MKRLLFLLIAAPFICQAQFTETQYQRLGTKTTHIKVLGVLTTDSALKMPVHSTQYLPSSLSRPGYLMYDSLGSDSGAYYWSGFVWRKIITELDTSTLSQSRNGITRSGGYFELGGELIKYTSLVTGSYPLTFTNTGLVHSSWTDSSALRFVNNTAATSITDSLTTAAIEFSLSGYKSNPPSAGTRNVRFSIRPTGASFTATSLGIYAYTEGLSDYTRIFSITNQGVIQNNLNIGGVYYGQSGSNPIIGSSTNLQSSTSSTNIAIGLTSSTAMTTGSENIAIGTNTLAANTISEENTAIGYGALALSDTNYNTVVGAYSFTVNTKGYENTGFGKNTGLNNTTGAKNSFIGTAAGENNTTGSFNTFVGHDAGLQNTTGNDNTGIGWLSWSQNITGARNTGLGESTGRSVVYGTNNTAVGHESMYNASQEDSVDNTIALGAFSYTTKNNQQVLGNNLLTETIIHGIDSTGSASDSVLVKTTNDVIKMVAQSSVGGLTIGSTTISGGSDQAVLYNNAGVLGNYTVTGSGTTSVLSTSPTFTNSIIVTGSSATGMIDINPSSATSIGLNIDGAANHSASFISLKSSTGSEFLSLKANGTGGTPNGLIVTTANNTGVPSASAISAGAVLGFNSSATNFYGAGLGTAIGGKIPIWFQTGGTNGGGYDWYVDGDQLKMRMDDVGRLGIGVTTPSAVLEIKAGTTAAGTAPIKLTTGSLLGTAEAGAIEFLTDKYYATITTGAARKELTLNDAALTSGTTPVATTNGRLTDGLILAQGTTNPTLTGVINVASTGSSVLHYTRVGNTVSFSCIISVTPTAGTTLTQVDFTIPVSSGFTTAQDLIASVSVTNTTYGSGVGSAETTNDRGAVQFTSIGTTAHNLHVSGHYTIK